MPIPEKLWSAGDPPRERVGAPPPDEPVQPPPPPRQPRPAPPPPAPRGRRRFAPLLAALLLVAALAGATGSLLIGGAGSDSRTASRTLPSTAAPLPGLKQSGNSVGRIYAAASPAVVSIRSGDGEGTGFVIKSDGTIVTNEHVVGSAQTVQVRFGDAGRTVEAKVLGADTSSDLAVVKVAASDVDGITPLGLADSDGVNVGDDVVAIGNPFGLDRTATAGIVSAIGRQIEAPDGFSIDKVIQTDAPINPGNSGGPLLDTQGKVIGVNSQIASAGSGGGNVGIGFAVPSNSVRDVVPALLNGTTIARPYLGISTTETGQGGSGATIAQVNAGSPAQSAGLRAGDVVVAVDGNPVGASSDIATAIAGKRPGDSVKVDVRRGGQRQSVDVELGTRPAQP
jgi:S1-C subfamily serine protease